MDGPGLEIHSVSPADDPSSGEDTPHLEPLNLPDSPPLSGPLSCGGGENDTRKEKRPVRQAEVDEPIQCLLCDEDFWLPTRSERMLKHLLFVHKLLVGDAHLIADLKSYINYWRVRFKERPLTEFCTIMMTNSAPTDTGPQEFYYFLTDFLPEDKELRDKLQQAKLEEILEQQHREREDTTFSRDCLFCRQRFEGNRSELFKHMVDDHNFHIGRPDNIVFCEELLDLLDEKLRKLQCLYCEKTFKDRMVLKEHMRKKQHKRIHPKNKSYDKYYLINYLDVGHSWDEVQSELDESELPAASSGANAASTATSSSSSGAGSSSSPSSTSEAPPVVDHGHPLLAALSSNESADWSDWEDDCPPLALCLFCTEQSLLVDDILSHMAQEHKFDFQEVSGNLGLDFYGQVKVVNYVRRQVHHLRCPCCSQFHASKEALLQHMYRCKHFCLPDTRSWDHPQYFFPTYENDRFLYGLDADSDSELSVQVYAEDSIPPEVVQQKRSELLQELLS